MPNWFTSELLAYVEVLAEFIMPVVMSVLLYISITHLFSYRA